MRRSLISIGTFVLGIALLLVIRVGAQPLFSATPRQHLSPVSPAAAATVLYHPAFARGITTSTLYVSNAGAAPATTTLQFSNGFSETVTIPISGTLVRPATDISGLPSDFNGGLIVTSNQTIRSVVTNRATSVADQLTLYTGTTSHPTSLFFGPVYKNSNGMNSALWLFNPGPSQANALASWTSITGTLVVTSPVVLPPASNLLVVAQTIAGLPDGFSGAVPLQSNQGLVGLLENASATLRQRLEPVGSSGSFAEMRYGFKAVDTGGGPRSTTIFLRNAAPINQNVKVSYKMLDGTTVASETVTLARNGTHLLDLGPVSGIPDYSTVGVSMVGSVDFVPEVRPADYDGQTQFLSNGDGYTIDEVNPFTYLLPAIQKKPDMDTTFTLTANDAITGTISYFDQNGTQVLTESLIMPPKSDRRFIQRDESALPAGFVGSVVIRSNKLLNGWVDMFLPPPPPPTPTPTMMATSTPTQVPTTIPTPIGTATPIPTPPPGGTIPELYVNYTAGAPGSTFLIEGRHFPPNKAIVIAINGTVVLPAVTSDANGAFSLLLQTNLSALDGYYVVTATVSSAANTAGSRPNAPAIGIQSGNYNYYQITRTGPDAVVRTAPPSSPPTSLTVPDSITPNSTLPFVYLPVVSRP